MGHCHNCGAEIGPGTFKCAYCGAAIQQQAHAMPPAMPPGMPPNYAPQAGVEQKSKVTAGLLAIFLGALGIHNFYSGHTKHGIIKLVLLLACGLGLVVSPIWSIIEMITVTKDAQGVQFS